MANSLAHSFFYRIVSASNVSPSRMADFACPHPPRIASLPTATPQLSVANAPGVDAHTTIPSDSEVEFLGGVVRRPSEHVRAIVDEQGGRQVLQLMTHQEHLGLPESNQVEMPVPAAVPVPVPVVFNTNNETQNFEMVRRQWQAMHNNILNDLEREYHYSRYDHHQQLQQYQHPSRPTSNSFSDISEESTVGTDNQNIHFHQGSLSHAETQYGHPNHQLSLEHYRNREVAPSFSPVNFESAGETPRLNTVHEAEFRLHQYSNATVHNFHADSRVCVYDHSNQSHHHNVPLRDLFEGARYRPQSLTFLSWPPRQPTTINRITGHLEDTSSASSSSLSSSSSYTSHSIDGSIHTGRDNGSYSSGWPQPAIQSANLGAHNRNGNLIPDNSSTAAFYTNRINHNNNQNNIFHLYTNHNGSQWIKVPCRADCPQNVDCIRITDNSSNCNPNHDPASHSPAFNRHHHHGLCICNHRNATIWQQLDSSITQSEYLFHQYHLQVDCDPGWSLGTHSNSSNLNSGSSGSSSYSHYQSALQHSQPHHSQPGASHSTIFTSSAPFRTSSDSSSSSRIGSHHIARPDWLAPASMAPSQPHFGSPHFEHSGYSGKGSISAATTYPSGQLDWQTGSRQTVIRRRTAVSNSTVSPAPLAPPAPLLPTFDHSLVTPNPPAAIMSHQQPSSSGESGGPPAVPNGGQQPPPPAAAARAERPPELPLLFNRQQLNDFLQAAAAIFNEQADLERQVAELQEEARLRALEAGPQDPAALPAAAEPAGQELVPAGEGAQIRRANPLVNMLRALEGNVAGPAGAGAAVVENGGGGGNEAAAIVVGNAAEVAVGNGAGRAGGRVAAAASRNPLAVMDPNFGRELIEPAVNEHVAILRAFLGNVPAGQPLPELPPALDILQRMANLNELLGDNEDSAQMMIDVMLSEEEDDDDAVEEGGNEDGEEDSSDEDEDDEEDEEEEEEEEEEGNHDDGDVNGEHVAVAINNGAVNDDDDEEDIADREWAPFLHDHLDHEADDNEAALRAGQVAALAAPAVVNDEPDAQPEQQQQAQQAERRRRHRRRVNRMRAFGYDAENDCDVAFGDFLHRSGATTENLVAKRRDYHQMMDRLRSHRYDLEAVDDADESEGEAWTNARKRLRASNESSREANLAAVSGEGGSNLARRPKSVFRCCICWDGNDNAEGNNFKCTPCGHVYCDECFNGKFRKAGSVKCGYCRQYFIREKSYRFFLN